MSEEYYERTGEEAPAPEGDPLVTAYERDVAQLDPFNPGEVRPGTSSWALQIKESRTRSITPNGTAGAALSNAGLAYGGDPMPTHEPLLPDERGQAHRSITAVPSFVEDYENAYDEANGTFSASFFAKYEAEDLRYLTKVTGLFGKDITDVVEQMERVEQNIRADAKERQELYHQYADEAAMRKTNSKMFWSGDMLWRGFLGFMGVDDITAADANDYSQPVRFSAEEREALRQQAADHQRNGTLYAEAMQIARELIDEGDTRLWDAYTYGDGSLGNDPETFADDADIKGMSDEDKEALANVVAVEIAKRLMDGQSKLDIKNRDRWWYRWSDNFIGTGMVAVTDLLGWVDGAVMWQRDNISNWAEMATDRWGQSAGDVVQQAGTWLTGGAFLIAAEGYEQWQEAQGADSALYDPLQEQDAANIITEFDRQIIRENLRAENHQDALAGWERISQDPESEVYQNFLQMGGFDPDAAMKLFLAEVTYDPGQLENWVNIEEDVAEEAFIAAKQVSPSGDFASSQPVLKLLASYGYNVPMRIATATAAYITDDEWREGPLAAAQADSLGAVWDAVDEKVRRNNFSPAQVMGVEGTLAGLFLDIGGGILADPTTWFIGPSAKAASVTTRTGIESAAFKGIGKVWADDIGATAATRGATLTVRRQLRWLGDYGRGVRRMIAEGNATAEEISRAVQNASSNAMMAGRTNDMLGRAAISVYGGNMVRRTVHMFNDDSLIGTAEGRLIRLIDGKPTRRYIPMSDPNADNLVQEIIESFSHGDRELVDDALQRLFDIDDNWEQIEALAEEIHNAAAVQVNAIDEVIEASKVWDGHQYPEEFAQYVDEAALPQIPDDVTPPEVPGGGQQFELLEADEAEFRNVFDEPDDMVDPGLDPDGNLLDEDGVPLFKGDPKAGVEFEENPALQGDLEVSHRSRPQDEFGKDQGSSARPEAAGEAQIQTTGDRTLEATVISGGQNGADMWALEVAEEMGHVTGGFAPAGDLMSAEDIQRLGLTVDDSIDADASAAARYARRTARNLLDADVTVAYLQEGWEAASTGTNKTVHMAVTGNWPAQRGKFKDWNMKQIGPGAWINEDGVRPVIIISGVLDDETAIAVRKILSQYNEINFAGPEPTRLAKSGLPGTDLETYKAWVQGETRKILPRTRRQAKLSDNAAVQADDAAKVNQAFLDEDRAAHASIAARRKAIEERKLRVNKALRQQRRAIIDKAHTNPIAQMASGKVMVNGKVHLVDRTTAIQQLIDDVFSEAIWRSDAWLLDDIGGITEAGVKWSVKSKARLGQWLVKNDKDLVKVLSYQRSRFLRAEWERLGDEAFDAAYPNVEELTFGLLRDNKKGAPAWHPRMGEPVRPKIEWDYSAVNHGSSNFFDGVKRAYRGKTRKEGESPGDNRQIFAQEAYERAAQIHPDTVGKLSHEQWEELANRTMPMANRRAAITTPADPYSMAMLTAPGLTRKAWNRANKALAMEGTRAVYSFVFALWMVDKLLGPRTAAVVAFDELMRVYHTYGIGRTLLEQGRGAIGRVYSKVARHNEYAAKGLSHEWTQDLIAALEDPLTNLHQAERAIRVQGSFGYETLNRNQIGRTPKSLYKAAGRKDLPINKADFDDAVDRQIGGMLSDSGFRAWLQGDEAFETWWRTSRDARRLKTRGVRKMDDDGRGIYVPPTMDEIKNMYEGVFPIVFNGKQRLSNGRHIRDVLKEQADRAAAGKKFAVTKEMRESIDVVRGARKVRTPSDRFFNFLFDQPLNRRRSLIYRLETRLERKRLMSLFDNLNKKLPEGKPRYRVMTDAQIAEEMGVDLSMAIETRMQHYQALLEKGVVAEGYITALASEAAQNSIDRMLYNWDYMSPALEAGRGVAPFIGPWADMWKYWIGEVGTRPYMRGLLNGRLELPANPKPFATASRVAATDFELENISDEDRPFLNFGLSKFFADRGVNNADLSSLLFLPTQGSSAWSTTLPQPGPIPLFAVELWMAQSEDNPEDWMQLRDWVAQFTPFAGFSQGAPVKDFWNILAGGGLLTRGMKAVTDLATAYGIADLSDARDSLQHFTNDWAYDSLVNQHIRALGADPDYKYNLKNLLSMGGSWEEVSGFAELAGMESEKRAAKDDAYGNQFIPYLIPVATDVNEVTEEVDSLWIDAAKNFPDLFGEAPPDSPSNNEFFAADARNTFYNRLDYPQQLMVLAADVNLAFNLVSAWEWGPNAKDRDVGPGPGILASPFRSGPTFTDEAQMFEWQRDRVIERMSPEEYMKRVFEVAAFARQDLMRQMYQDTMINVNRHRWEVDELNVEIGTELQDFIDGQADNEFLSALGIEDPFDLWVALGSLDDDVEDWAQNQVAQQNPDETDTEFLKELVAEVKSWELPKIKTNQKAYSLSVPDPDNMDQDRLSQPFDFSSDDGALVFEFDGEQYNMLPDYADQAASILGIDLDGLDLRTFAVEARNEWSKDYEAKMAATVLNHTFSLGRSAVGIAVDNQFKGMDEYPEFDYLLRDEINQFVAEQSILEKKREYGYQLSNAEKAEIRQRFGKIVALAPHLEPQLRTVWDTTLRSLYGDQDYELPMPPESIYKDDGTLEDFVWKPDRLLDVVDGDTLKFEQRSELPFNQSLVNPRGDTLGQSWRGVPQGYGITVRLLGVNAGETRTEEGTTAADRLEDAIRQAHADGKNLHLVIDLETSGKLTSYDRVLAWLFIGDEPYTDGIEGFEPLRGRYEDALARRDAILEQEGAP